MDSVVGHSIKRMTPMMHKVALLKSLFVLTNGVGSFAALFMSRHFALADAELATMVSLMIISYLAGNLLGGQLPGRMGSRILLLGCSSTALLALLGSLLPILPIAMGMILLFMFNAGAITPLFSVMTAQAAPSGDQVGAFAYLHLASNAGGVLLFVVGGVLLSLQSQYLLWFTAVISLVCLVTSAVLTLPMVESHLDTHKDAQFESKSVPIPAVVILAGVMFFVLSLLDGQREYQFPLWLGALGVGDAAHLFGVAGIVNGLLVIVLTRPLIALSRRCSAMANMALAAICYGIGFGAYALLETWPAILLMVVVWTLGEIIGITYMATLIAQRAPRLQQGFLFSLIPVIQAAARVLCVTLAVPMLDGLGFSVTWASFGCAGVIFGVACLFLQRARLDQ